MTIARPPADVDGGTLPLGIGVAIAFRGTVLRGQNASYNEVVLAAAILQLPLFDVHADPAVNFGAIGAVIGHDIGNGFDDQGSRSDFAGMRIG